MKYLIKSFSYIFHPLFMPISGVVLYFIISPRFFDARFLYSKLFATTILTIIIPILSFYVLKNVKLVTEINLKNVKERRFPLLLQIIFTFMILKIVFDGYEIPVLYYFFLGILGSSVAAFFLVLFKFKSSLHMIGVAGLVTFIFGLSIHFGQNLLVLLSVLIIGIGGTASSRIQAKAHSLPELIIGFVIGMMPQLYTFEYWL